jgi:hypothetical protein
MHILWSQTMDPKRVKSYNLMKMCMYVDVWWIYLVSNLILLCSLKTYLSFQTWKYFCKRTGVILFISFSFHHLSTHYFKYLGHLSIFSQLFFSFLMNNFCIALCLFSAIKLWEISIRIWSIYLVEEKPNKHVFVFTPSVGVEHFWVVLDGRHVFAYFQCRSSRYMWCVRDLDFKSMTNLS